MENDMDADCADRSDEFKRLKWRAHCGQWDFDDLLYWYYLQEKDLQKVYTENMKLRQELDRLNKEVK